MRLFGAHISASGGIENSLVTAHKVGINTIQIYPSPPQRWNTAPFTSGVEDSFLRQRPLSGVKKVFFHAIYLINMATPDRPRLELAITSLAHYLDLCARVQGDGVIFHVGSLKDQEDQSSAIEQVVSGIEQVLDRSPSSIPLLLEVAAGSGKVIGHRFEELAAIRKAVKNPERVYFALDTQHMWASGYDIKGNLSSVVSDAERILGLDNIKAIHLNDSKTPLASRIDRHENFGRGLIGWEGLTKFANHPKLKKIPLILETPNLKEPETLAEEVTNARTALGA